MCNSPDDKEGNPYESFLRCSHQTKDKIINEVKHRLFPETEGIPIAQGRILERMTEKILTTNEEKIIDDDIYHYILTECLEEYRTYNRDQDPDFRTLLKHITTHYVRSDPA